MIDIFNCVMCIHVCTFMGVQKITLHSNQITYANSIGLAST